MEQARETQEILQSEKHEEYHNSGEFSAQQSDCHLITKHFISLASLIIFCTCCSEGSFCNNCTLIQ